LRCVTISLRRSLADILRSSVAETDFGMG
jgi:hypothetical protein